MNINKILLGGLVGGVFAFFFGWLLWGIIFTDMPDGLASVSRAESDFIMWALVVSNLLWGVLMAFIFVHWAGISTWLTGLKAGAILGFLITSAFDFGWFAMTKLFTLQEVAFDVVLNTFYVAVVGAVIGWFVGWKK